LALLNAANEEDREHYYVWFVACTEAKAMFLGWIAREKNGYLTQIKL
jgi:hypothetical protein